MKMKKLFLAATLALTAMFFVACNTQPVLEEPGTDTTTIITIGPNITEIAMGLGFGEKIVATDTNSADVPGVPQGIPLLDMFAIDIETILILEPTVVIATSMIKWDVDPLALVSQTGVRVVYVPMANSLAEIMESFGTVNYAVTLEPHSAAAYNLQQTMQQQIDQIRSIVDGISTERTVYFEIDMGPPLFTFGQGSFLQEIIEITGATNVFGNEPAAWVAVADEQVFARNPDVILTNVPGIDNALDIMSARPGWSGIYAVANERVYSIDNNASSRPSQNIVYGMWEIARAIFPEYFQ